MVRGWRDDPGSEQSFAELSALLDGYFHEDFRAEHGNHEAAARAFAREASQAEVKAAREALERFLDWAEAEERPLWQSALRKAGGAWRPRSLEPVREVLAVLRDVSDTSFSADS